MPCLDECHSLDPMSRRTWRKTDKCVQAEMKNKMELARLAMCKKLYERQQSRAGFLIDKDKRQVATAMRKMRDTSGYSLEAMPPDGVHDTVYEKTAYFHDRSAVREKQLQRWRATEREVVRTVYAEEDRVLKTPWENDPFENITQSFNSMMRRMGYDVIDEDKLVLQGIESVENDGANPSEDPLIIRHKSAQDVFECLKTKDSSQHSDSYCKESTALTENRKFSVPAWEKKTVQNYLSVVTRPVSAPCVRSRKKRMRTAFRPRSHPIGAENYTNYSKLEKAEFNNNNKCGPKMVRPHTAAAPQRLRGPDPAKKCRPKSFETQSNQTPVTDYNLTEVNSDLKDSDQKGANEVTDRTIRPNGLSLRRLSTIDESDTQVNMTSSQNKQNLSVRNQNNVNKPYHLHQHHEKSLKKNKANTVNRNIKTKKANSVRQKAKANSNSNTLTPDNSDPSRPMDNGTKTLESVSYNSSLASQTNCEIATGYEQGVGQNNKSQSKKEEIPHHELSPMEEEAERKMLIGQELPHWKRDLLIEAPPSVFSLRTPLKVGLVMSKAQRKRELEQMVDDNIRDVKGMVEREQGRRIHARLSLYVTLNQMEQALAMERDLAVLAATRKAHKKLED